MRPAPSVLRRLLLAAIVLLAAATVAEANPPYRGVPVVPYSRGPVSSPGARVGTGVYVFPQITTTPSYYPLYSYPYGWYGGYSYYPTYSPYWGSYYGPSYSYWFWLR